jgi:hypothetical protein
MGTRTRLVLLAVAILTVGFGVVDSQAVRKHAHGVKMKHYASRTTLPPANDPRTAGVEGAAVRCPRGYKATGGGFDSNRIAVVPSASLAPRGYAAIAINQTNEAGTLEVQVGCLKTKTTARRASSAGRSLRGLVERYRRQIRER